LCGIAGIFNLDDNVVASEVLMNMLARIRYRGPDESGLYINKNLGIGNVRLSIIDLSTGQQPISNHDDTLWIVYNGEVFNYPELRADLIKRGIQFKTDSDTEVILKYFEAYGEKCLEYFNGQFAFAIWDTKKQELFLARDRMGIRPLFYTNRNNSFVFASEIKSILEVPGINASIDLNALQQIFTYWTTLTPSTVFQNILELPPGHYLKINKHHFEIKKYWDLKFPADQKTYIKDIEEASTELSNLLEDAVRIRLRADVPVAAYLSGGIDSSATTYFIKKVAYNHLRTFSIGFEDKDYDETFYQNEVSTYLNTEHTAFTCTNKDIAESFPDVIWHTEIPILRTAPVPMYLLSKNVRNNNIKVVVTGEGADEMLGGYDIFKEMVIRRFWAKYPDSQIRPLLLKKLYPYIPALHNQSGNMLKFFFGYKLNETESPVYSHLLRWHNAAKISSYLSPELQAKFKTNDVLTGLINSLDADFYEYHPLSKAQWLESTIFMSGYLLSSQGDRMAMANSVEGRYPFLDYRVIEYCAKIHPELKLHGLNEKYILKKMMAGKIPESVLRRPKQAYRAPISNSFLGHHPPDYLHELLSEEIIRKFGIFDPKRVDDLVRKLRLSSSAETENMAIAAIISTQLLYQQFLVSKPSLKVDMNDCRIIRQNK